MLTKLVDIQYDRNDVEFERGKFRVRGDCVEIWPAYEEFAYRIEFWGDEVEQLGADQSDQRRESISDRSSCSSIRQSISSCRKNGSTTPSSRSSKELTERLEQLREAGQVARGPAA